MKKLSTMNAKATMMIIPIHVGTVASFVIIEPVATLALVSAPDDTPPTCAAVCSSCNTINPIARTIATVTMLRINPCNPPIWAFFNNFIFSKHLRSLELCF